MSDPGDDIFLLPDDAAKYVDIETFEQILEMDEDPDDKDFSKPLVFGFFDQAETTFDEMDIAITEKDLDKLSALGHFLKGSSATLGIKNVRDSCEKIQHWGAKKDETGNKDISEEKALKYIKDIVPQMKKEYTEVETWLKQYFGNEE
ncbi:hypothetical protein ABW20_dc0104551 [Dactylellina cionopaga]|nr:hypothetical protein ABW20_dc0104551 [Dactylellina cionopaga]